MVDVDAVVVAAFIGTVYFLLELFAFCCSYSYCRFSTADVVSVQ